MTFLLFIFLSSIFLSAVPLPQPGRRQLLRLFGG